MANSTSPPTATATPLVFRPQSVTAAEQAGEPPPVMREARYYATLENAVQGAANSALRDCIASDEVQSLHDAVEALRTISKEIRAAVSVLDTNAAGK